ncbi:thiamine pyrophosphate enzyme [Loa loa]|uniref:2-hydroxyacyl-CoA lyase 2 n=1 Tax=Loa loa TaxID=7209 RepID=A0A1S0UFN1_LOALO|nr:thiamine pyrophosphate enzyme [Loa loa]EJD74363.1 thiamine pyrophosphate enzyme [Loa loa]
MMFLLVEILVIFVASLLWLIRIIDIDSIKTFRQILLDLYTSERSHWILDLFQVDEKSEHHGGELVAAVLKAHNINEIFTLCGGHISPILVAAQNLGIHVYDTRHEVNAVFAADAVARLRQSVGVAVVTAGPGLTNTITAVKNAQMAETAVLIIAGAAPVLSKNRGALQDIDQISLMRPLCKHVARITRIKDIVMALKKAMHIAQSGTPGPVFVEIPIDVLYPYKTVLKEMNIFKPRSFKQTVVNSYLLANISRQFSGGWLIKEDMLPIPARITFPNKNDIAKLMHLVLKSKKPVIVIGSQAVLAPVSVHELKNAVKSIGIPTFLTGMSRGLLGQQSPIHMRYNRKDTLKEADLIILAGAVCDFRLSYGRALSPYASVVSINRDRAQMLKNEGIFWRVKLAIQADVATALVNLADYLLANDPEHGLSIREWISYLTAKEKAKNAENMNKMKESFVKDGINPLYVLSLINKVLPENAILIADGGDFIGSAAYIVHPRGPLQWLDPGVFGTLGVGAGFALGAKAVYPNRPVVILYGDGSCGFSLMEFDTFSRHKLSVIALIGNDACWSQIAREQIATLHSSVAVDLQYTRYDNVGAALGASGALIANQEDLTRENFEQIFASATDGGSVVVNIIIGKSNFRDGSICV